MLGAGDIESGVRAGSSVDGEGDHFNDLRSQGYSFRLYHPGWVRGYLSGTKNLQAALEPEEAAVPALAHFLGERDDEDELALYDWQGQRWPW